MIVSFLSARAFRLVVLVYALCLLYLTVAPLAVFAAVVLLFWRVVEWLIRRFDRVTPGEDPPPAGGQRVHPRSPSGRW